MPIRASQPPLTAQIAESLVARRSVLLIAVGVVAATYTDSAAAGASRELQGAILGKALSYAQSLKAEKANVLVVSRESVASVQPLVDAFNTVGTNVKLSGPESVDAELALWADAAYIPPGQLTASIREFCITQKVLSMSGSVEDVEAGRAAMAVGVNGDKPQLVVNLSRVTAEGHKFSARLLQLARLVG
ncbi:MAG: hypothetical protein RJA70_4985 [Pseudomonadota bacterium]|jgi:hypothetical protein